MSIKIAVITGYGINCEEETAHCFDQAGGKSEIIHINSLINKEKNLKNYNILAFPGGFSYGDDTGSGNALANKIKNNLSQEILQFAKSDKLIIGICNGFQILTNLGLVPATDEAYDNRQSILMHNASVRYQCRWIYVKNISKKCIWTKGIDQLHLPIAHGEGNFFIEKNILNQMKKNDQIVLKYVTENGKDAKGKFPDNPNGAMEDIAAICDPSGRIFGLMPHPERFNSFTNEDGWPLKKEFLIRAGKSLPTEGDGMQIFKNAIKYFK